MNSTDIVGHDETVNAAHQDAGSSGGRREIGLWVWLIIAAAGVLLIAMIVIGWLLFFKPANNLVEPQNMVQG